MKIKYEFQNGDVVESEVEDSLGEFITLSRRLEDNLSRKERNHCLSLEAVKYEGKNYADKETPETLFDKYEADKHLYETLQKLSEVQRRRLLMFAEGMSIREIARVEKVQHHAVAKSIEGARKIFKKFFENGYPN